MHALIDKLEQQRSLTLAEYEELILNRSTEAAEYLAGRATAARRSVYGNKVFFRGLIEISNICKNNCRYCGIRAANSNCSRYRLRVEDIFGCCREGYRLGLRTFVLQGGEDPYFTDDVLYSIVHRIKTEFPDCAVTLSLGERSRESYQRLYDAGADRYLLRHETADKRHYDLLHPSDMSFENRLRCLRDLKDIGYQTGCGFMVGSPYQTAADLAKDLKFVEEFKPQMCGIGPFIPQKDTEFASHPAGSAELTCYLLSIIRLIDPAVLLPATTALSTIYENGREFGILSGANVIMPNLSPISVREKYTLYDNKAHTGYEAAESINDLCARLSEIGYEVAVDRGDHIDLHE